MTATAARDYTPGLTWLTEERGLTPRRVLPFALAPVLAFVLCPPLTSEGVVSDLVAAVFVLVAFAAVTFVPWRVVPAWMQVIPALAFVLAIALLRSAAGPAGSALAVMLLVPLIWIALVGDRFSLILVILASALVLLVPVVSAGPLVTLAEWRRALLYMIVSPLIGTSVQRLVADIRGSSERLKQLRASSEAIVRSVGDGLVVLDADDRVVEVNDVAEQLLRHDREELLGATLDDLLGSAEPVRGVSEHRLPSEMAAPKAQFSGEYLVGRGDGTTLPVKVTVAPLVADDPEAGRVLAFRDITERLRARRLGRAKNVVTTALAEADDYISALPRITQGLGEVLDAAVVTVWDLVPDGEAGGEEVLTLRDYWEDPAVPRPEYARLTRGKTRPGLPARVVSSGHAEWITEVAEADPASFPRVRAAAAEGLRTLIALPLGSGEPVGVLEVDFDRSESPDDLTRDLLGSLAARIGDTARRERLEAESARLKQEFTALVSHELRTPLTSISGYLELLGDEVGEDPMASRFLEVIGRNTARLRRLVEDLLFVARVDAGRLSLRTGECDLAAIVETSVDAVRPAADTGRLTLSAEVDGPVPVLGDADRLGQVLDNLLSNAVKFTPPGRSVSVVLRRGESGAGLGQAVLEVVDTGMGISERDLERLFGRFMRSAEAERANIPGVGLGLVITRAIVDAHGGSIHVESAPGQGTTFRVELPLAAAGRTAAIAPEAHA